MSTFAECKKKRPADPTLVAQHKARMERELNREQLADIIVESSSDCDHPTPCGWCRGLADAIIQAGWTAPPTPAQNATTDN